MIFTWNQCSHFPCDLPNIEGAQTVQGFIPARDPNWLGAQNTKGIRVSVACPVTLKDLEILIINKDVH